MNTKKIAITIIAISVVVAVSFFSIVYLTPKPETQTIAVQEEFTPREYFEKGQQAFEDKNYELAYSSFAKAVELEPDNADFHWGCARAAFNFKIRPIAYQHCVKSWELGKKESAVLILMTTAGLHSDPLDFALTKLQEMPLNWENRELKARLLSKFAKKQEAFELWFELNIEKPSPEISLKIARVLVDLGQFDKAQQLSLSYWQEGIQSESLANIIFSFMNLSGDFEKANKFVSDNPKFWNTAEMQLKEAISLFSQGLMLQASQKLSSLRDSITTEQESEFNPTNSAVAHNCRIYMGYIAAMQNDYSACVKLSQAAKEASCEDSTDGVSPTLGLYVNKKRLQGEIALHDFLAQQNHTNIDQLIEARKLMPGEPLVDMLFARLLTNNQNPQRGLNIIRQYQNTNSSTKLESIKGMLCRSPLIVTEFARSLWLSGESESAIQLLGELHSRNLFTKGSMQLYAKLLESVGELEKSWETQMALERTFPEATDIKASTALLAHKLGYFDKALAILTELSETNDNPDYHTLMLTAMLRTQDPQTVINRCNELNIPEGSRNIIKARANIKLGDKKTADQFYEKSLNKDTLNGYLEYAAFLIREGNLEKSETLYSEVVAKIGSKDAFLGLSEIARLRGDYHKAANFIKRIGWEQNNPMQYVQLSQLSMLSQDADAALEYSNRALGLDANNIAAKQIKLTAMLLNYSQQADPSMQKYSLKETYKLANKYITQHPDAFEFKKLLVKIQRAKGDYSNAIDNIDKLITAQPKQDFTLEKMQLLSLAGESKELKHMLSTSQTKLASKDAALLLADSYLNNKQFSKALTTLKPLVQKDISCAHKYALICIESNRTNDMDLRCYQFSPQQWMQLSTAAIKTGDTNKAIELLEMGIKQTPRDAQLLNNFAWIAKDLNQQYKREALRASKNAFQNNPTNPLIMDTYATVLNINGSHDEVIELLRSKNLTASSPLHTMLQLSIAYEKTAQTLKAIDQLETMLTEDELKWQQSTLSKQSISNRIEFLRSTYQEI